MTRRGAALVVSGVVTMTAAFSAVVIGAPSTAGAAPCAYAPTSIAVVVDFGDGSAASAVCVPADSSDNGADVLAARARQLGTPQPRYSSSGLLCAIDGYPADGCGEQNGSTYAYWSYWHGSTTDTGSSWDYENLGPAGSRVQSGVVEGWRFQPNGAGNPNDPPPNGSPDARATCAPAPPPTAVEDTTSPATGPQTPAAVEPSTGSSTGGPAPTAAPSTTSSPIGSSASSARSPTGPAPSTTGPTPGSSQAAAGAVRVTAPARHSSPWPAVGAGAAIAGLGSAGALVARRRRRGLPS